jgi:hypothetical protein
MWRVTGAALEAVSWGPSPYPPGRGERATATYFRHDSALGGFAFANEILFSLQWSEMAKSGSKKGQRDSQTRDSAWPAFQVER